jgi:hypothetical protein
VTLVDGDAARDACGADEVLVDPVRLAALDYSTASLDRVSA